ncbi:MAG: phasin family protein [Xanthomonadales bacterium]|nr:phasin family protein [Xanthomonadales bacterium]MBN8794974.1 phasin family protein [Stenotrophomonas nitritireducens]
MAKLKKTAAKTTRKPSSKPAGGSKGKAGAAGKLHVAFNPKSLTESAQQIWLAGMGAFTRAQAEGGKLFETLVRDGLSLEQTARQFAGSRASAVRDAVEGQVGQARERAADTWDKLEKVFEERVQRALVKLGVPGRDDLHALSERVERLTEAVRKASGGAPATSAPAKKAAGKAAKPARKPAKAAGAAARKAPAKPAPKAAKAAKPAAPAEQAQ